MRIEVRVRIAEGMHVAHRAIDAAGHLEQLQLRVGLEVAGRAGLMRALPDSRSSTGSQPISSWAPAATTRSAERARAIRLGLASIRAGLRRRWSRCRH
ncbi:MAG: hypothetical protein U1F06_08675 [Steroidobacteraceae bacterium]